MPSSPLSTSAVEPVCGCARSGCDSPSTTGVGEGVLAGVDVGAGVVDLLAVEESPPPPPQAVSATVAIRESRNGVCIFVFMFNADGLSSVAHSVYRL